MSERLSPQQLRSPNARRLVISIYDRTGNWAKPYANAGYAVHLWDKEHEGCILEHFDRLLRIIDAHIATGGGLWGILAAPPCTHFAGSGARWWKTKDATPPEDGDTWNIIDYAQAYALIILHLVELYQPKFWSLENPIGRLERLVPELRPHRKMTFDPRDYGDPYTKKTVLYGQFNCALPGQPTLFIFSDYIHNLPPTPDRAAKRSITPMGFAKAFYAAN